MPIQPLFITLFDYYITATSKGPDRAPTSVDMFTPSAPPILMEDDAEAHFAQSSDYLLQMTPMVPGEGTISTDDINFETCINGMAGLSDVLAALYLTHVDEVAASSDAKVIGWAVLAQLRVILDSVDDTEVTLKDQQSRRELKVGIEFLLKGLEEVGKSEPDVAARCFTTSFTNSYLGISRCVHKEHKVLAATVAVTATLADDSCAVAAKAENCTNTLDRLYSDQLIAGLYARGGLLNRKKRHTIQGQIENLSRVVWTERLPGLSSLSQIPLLQLPPPKDKERIAPALEWHGEQSLRVKKQRDVFTSTRSPREFGEMTLYDVKLLACALEPDVNTSLRELHLENSHLTADGCRHIAESLAMEGSHLIELYVRVSSIGDEGCGYLADALSHNTALVHLDLWRCGIGAAGAESLARMLSTNRCIDALNLRDNLIGDDGAFALADALVERNTTLHKLSLDRNEVTAAGKEALENVRRKGICKVSM